MSPIIQDASNTLQQALSGVKKSVDVESRNLEQLKNNPDSVAQQVLSVREDGARFKYQTVEIVDDVALQRARGALLEERGLNVKLESLQSLEKLFGEKGDLNSFVHLGDALSNSFHNLAISTRENFSGNKINTFNDLNNLLNSMQSFSEGVQLSQKQADENIAKSLANINKILSDIAKFNTTVTPAGPEDFSAIDGQRESLNKLAEEAGFYVRNNSDGTIRVYIDATGEHRLVYKGTSATFTYDPPSSYEAGTAFTEIGISYEGNTYESLPGITNFTPKLLGLTGPLASNLNIRDIVTPALNEQINNVATELFMSFNEVHNEGTATPLRPVITGEGLPAGIILDDVGISGTIRFALINSMNKVSHINNDHIDIDLAGYTGYLGGSAATLDIFADFLNNQFTTKAPPLGISASVNAKNQLEFTSGNPAIGIAIGEDVNTTTNVQLQGAPAGLKFSHFFGLNNLFSSDVPLTDANFAGLLRLRTDIVENQGRGIAAGRLSMDASLSVHSSVIEGTDIAEELSDAWRNQAIMFSPTGTLDAREITLSEYSKLILTNHSEAASSTKKTYDFAKIQHERASKVAADSSKKTREEMENNLSELATYQGSLIHAMRVAIAMKDSLNDLMSRR